MKCNNCGQELPEGVLFCTECGAKIEVAVENPYYEETVSEDIAEEVKPKKEKIKKEKTKKEKPEKTKPKKEKRQKQDEQVTFSKVKKILIPALVAIIALVIAAAVVYFLWYSSAEQRLFRALDAKNYEKALEIYQDDYEGEDSDELINLVEQSIMDIKANYNSGATDVKTALEDLEYISKMGVYSTGKLCRETKEWIEKMSLSKENFDTAESLFESGEYINAIEMYSLVEQDDKNYETAQQKIDECKKEYCGEMTAKADKCAENEDFDGAIAIIEQALGYFPDDKDLELDKLSYMQEKASKQRSEILESAEEKADEGDYVEAYNMIKEALKGNPDDEVFKEALETYKSSIIDEALETAKNQRKQNKTLEALKTINKAIDTVGSDEALEDAAETYETDYAEDVVDSVDKLLDKNDVEGAKAIIDTVPAEISGNELIVEKKNELSQYKTVLLDSLSPINGGFAWNSGLPADPFKNDYSSVKNYTIFHADGSDHWRGVTYSAEYRIDKGYSTISLQISPYEDCSQSASSYIKIYADNELRYVSDKIHQKKGIVKVENIDISEAEYLIIKVCVSGYGCVMLSDVSLSSVPSYESSINRSERSLATIDTLNGSLPWNNEFPADRYNNSYNHVKNYSALHADGSDHWRGITYSAEYYIDGNYSYLEFDVAPHSDFGEDANTYVKVYVDDELKYTSPAITQKTKKFGSGKIDIADATYLKIVVEVGDYGCIILSDVVVCEA